MARVALTDRLLHCHTEEGKTPRVSLAGDLCNPFLYRFVSDMAWELFGTLPPV